MNRRNRKKKQSSFLEQLKTGLQGVGRKDKAGAVSPFWQRLPTFHQRALMVLVPLLLVLFVLPAPEPTPETEPAEPKRVEVSVNTTALSQQRDVPPGPRTEPAATVNAATTTTPATATKRPVVRKGSWQEYKVQAGDTLAKVFRTNQLSMTDLNALVKIEGLDKPLSKIKQGQLVRYKLTADGKLDILQLEKNGSSVMFFRLAEGGFGRSN